MTADMVQSQFSILEEPRPQETDIITVDVSGNLDDVKKEVLAKVHQTMEKDML